MKKFDPRDYSTICKDCALLWGAAWPTDHLATMCVAECSVCHIEGSVCDVTDWQWPGKQPGLREL
jgi:hypothetical protein